MMKPLSNYVVVSEIEAKGTTAGGLYIPETARKEPTVRARVLAIGPGLVNDKGVRLPMSVKVGDEVIFTKRRGQEQEICGETVIVVPETDILATVEE